MFVLIAVPVDSVSSPSGCGFTSALRCAHPPIKSLSDLEYVRATLHSSPDSFFRYLLGMYGIDLYTRRLRCSSSVPLTPPPLSPGYWGEGSRGFLFGRRCQRR